jgi:hypothetical protein
MLYYLQEGIEGSANIKKVFKECNDLYFGGAIPNIKLKWNGKLKKAVGRAYVEWKGGSPRKVSKFLAKYQEEIPVSENIELNMNSLQIDISKTFDLSMDDLKAVMLHEQVHILLYTQKKIGNHHDSPEFQNWIKKLAGQSGLNIPMRESDFKASPKLSAKEGYAMLIYDRTNVGLTHYSKNFIVKNWLALGQFLSRMVGKSSKMSRVEMYKVKHPIIASEAPRRSLRSISWAWIDEETAKEIQQKGTKFLHMDKSGGEMRPFLVVSNIGNLTKGAILTFDNKGNWTNAQEVTT